MMQPATASAERTVTKAESSSPERIFVTRVGSESWTTAYKRARQSHDPQKGMVRAAASISDANTWPVRGNKSSDKSYWQNLTLQVDGAYCTASSCPSKVTDRLIVKVTVNPGTQASRVDFNVQYPLRGGGFKSRVYYIQAICNGSMCGSTVTNRNQALGGFSQTISGYGDRAGKRLTIGVALSQTTVANTVQDMGKTADCLGRTGSDRRCCYIYN